MAYWRLLRETTVQRPCASCLLMPVRSNSFKAFPAIRSVASKKRMYELQDVVDKVVGVKRVSKRPIPEDDVWHANPKEVTYEEAKQENRALIYLCNWEVKLIGPVDRESDTVRFVVSMPMNKVDILQYLKVIYGLDIVSVRTCAFRGAVLPDKVGSNRILFEPDYKVAYVKLKDTLFKFPSAHELFPEHFEEGDELPKPARESTSDIKIGYKRYVYLEDKFDFEKKKENHHYDW